MPRQDFIGRQITGKKDVNITKWILLQDIKLYGWKFVSIKVVIVHSDAQTDYDLYLWSMVCLRGLVWHETSTQSNFIQWVVDLQLGDTNKHWFIKNRTKLISVLPLNSLYMSRAVNLVSHFFWTEFEIWAGFGPVGSTENCTT